MQLPTGTVTLLFTDIEGSTRLLHELGDAYADVLAEHRRVLREAFGRHGGVEVDTQGDAFFYAFARATDAAAAADEAQRALAAGPVRVRMGIHSGEPRVTDEGYVGIEVHQAARIMSAAHGGQVLVSEASAKLLASTVERRDLGEHRLKDLSEPERLYQLGNESFPPLRTLNNTNLPLQLEPLLGRKREMAELLQLVGVDGVRLVTITGPGGIGKTRLAVELAAELVPAFGDGVWFVDLSRIRDPALVEPMIIGTLGAAEELAERIGNRVLALVLDNFEHVLSASASVAALLSRCPRLLVVVTSREPLHIAGERQYALRPLPEAPAVELFRQRAAAAGAAFDAPYADVAAVCARLDSLPLAIELAAARARALAPDELRKRLEHRLPLLTKGRRDAPERQRTLGATIEWSYDLLNDGDKELFVRLSIFADSFDLRAAEVVCAADVDTLESLVEKSLLRQTSERRFSMLETIREFAAERLDAAGARDMLEGALAQHVVERTDPAGENFEPDAGNWRAAVAHAFDTGDHDLAERLVLGSRPWRLPPTEVIDWIDRVLEEQPQSAQTRARLLGMRSWESVWVGDLDAAVAAASEVVHLQREREDLREVARGLNLLGSVLAQRADAERAEVALRDAVSLAEAVGERRTVASASHHLGELLLARGDWRAARSFLERALERFGAEGIGRALVLHGLGDLALEEGDLRRARRLYRQALREANSAQFYNVISHALAGLAAVAAVDDDFAGAASLWRAANRLAEERGFRLGPAEKHRYERRLGAITTHTRPERGSRGVAELVAAEVSAVD